MKKWVVVLWIVLFFVAAQDSGAAKPIKFATLAPEGSVWMKTLRKGARTLRKRSKGAIRLRYYPGGVAGDEAEVVRKMRLGQFQAAGMTGVGLAEILPDIQVLELPLLFRNGEEVDAVLEKTFDLFSRKFAEKGFRLLGLTETGFVHFYGRVPLNNLGDFKDPAVNSWLWDIDQLHRFFFEKLGMHGIPLGVPEVLTGLQTGMLNVVNGPPAAAVALQWHTKIDGMTPEAYWWTPGGVVLSEKAWKLLSAEEKDVLSRVAMEMSIELRRLARRDNKSAFLALKQRGIKVFTPFSAGDRARLEKIAADVKQEMVGKLFSRDLLESVEAALAEVRSQGAAH